MRHVLMDLAQAHGLARWPRWLCLGCWWGYLLWQPWDEGLRIDARTAWAVAQVLTKEDA